MTNLIVRPIDDDRYSEFSKLLYINMLIKYKSPFARYEMSRRYQYKLAKAAQAWHKTVKRAVIAVSEAFSRIDLSKALKGYNNKEPVLGGERVIKGNKPITPQACGMAVDDNGNITIHVDTMSKSDRKMSLPKSGVWCLDKRRYTLPTKD